jgi:hypothetical protein
MQNYNYISQFIDKIKENMVAVPENVAELKAKALFYGVEYLKGLNFSFQDTFFIAGLFGLLGALPVIYMWSDLINHNSNNISK